MSWIRALTLGVSALVLLTACKKSAGEACSGGECGKGLACVGTTEDAVPHSPGTRPKNQDPKLQRAPKPGEQTCQVCESGEECTGEGWCYCWGGEHAAPGDEDRKEGCPCGCDHSEEMTAELRAQHRADTTQGGEGSLRSLDQSLQIIAKREQAGYITEAMVQHRLRLLKLRGELQQTSSDPEPPALSALAQRLRLTRSQLPALESATLRVRGRLLVHGEATELVRGKPKRLRPSFRLWLELTNKTASAITLSRPSLDAEPALPVSRWYLEDTTGEPFTGLVPARESRSVLVIGYLARSVEPGTRVAARAHVGELSVPVSAVAGKHWDKLLEPPADHE